MSANDRRNRVSAASANDSGRGPGKKSGGKKRGVVLLLVLSLLTLFIMIGVTYSLVAMNYRSASRAGAQIGLVGDNPQLEMEQVLSQLMVDTAQRTSIAGHSL